MQEAKRYFIEVILFLLLTFVGPVDQFIRKELDCFMFYQVAVYTEENCCPADSCDCWHHYMFLCILHSH